MDRVSGLPDEVICHVLSFLKTKEAALTSVLAKRWRNLWAHVPNIDIDDSVFLHPGEYKRHKKEIQQSFLDFVDRTLALQGNSPIKKFSLKCIAGISKVCVNRWICKVLERGVSVLDLFLDFSDFEFDSDSVSDSDSDSDSVYHLPLSIFVSKTLVKIKLATEWGDFRWPLGEDIFLPMLKTLIIKGGFIHGGMLKRFLPSFLELEELSIAIVLWLDLDATVSSASLRKLTIYSAGSTVSMYPKSFSFDTPSLLYLKYFDCIAQDYPKVNLTNLVEAQLNILVANEDEIKRIRAPRDEDDENDVFLVLGNVWKLFNGIRNVQKLYLSAETLEVLSLCCESMPVFNNLKFLRITSAADRGWQAMPVLLRNCPHLETLVLEGLLHFETDKCRDACECVSREDEGRSLLSSPVRKLQIKGFKGTMKESGMIRHFMESFPRLEEMEVYAEENDPTIFEIPGMMKIVAQMLYKEFFSYDVKFSVYTPMCKNWIEQ